MPFAILTQSIPNAMMVTGSLRSLINNYKIRIFSGPVPATAEEAIDGSSDLLVSMTKDGDGSTNLTWQATSTNGVLRKTTADVASGEIDTTGTATFFRVCIGSDDGTGAAGGSDHRVQGTIGDDMTYDMFLTDPSLVATEDLTLTDIQLNLPTVQQ